MCAEPWNTLTINYTCTGEPSRPPSAFTVDNDRHLVCMALQVGYGRWDELTREVRKSWVCKFDWHMKTRAAAELGKRVEYLTKLIERELADADAAKKEEEKKAKKGGGGGGGEPSPGSVPESRLTSRRASVVSMGAE